MMNKIEKLRSELKKLSVNGFIVPVNDEFQSEFVPDHSKRLEWLTGFSGSAGMAIILEKKAVFFTDGRYVLQASKQLAINEYEIHNIADITAEDWMEENIANDYVIGIDPMLHSYNNFKHLENAANKKGFSLKSIVNPLDKLWKDRPEDPEHIAFNLGINCTGQYAESKIENIRNYIEDNKVDSVLITSTDSICWLLNIRGSDSSNSPLLLSYCLVHKNGNVDVFVNPNKITDDLKAELADSVSFHDIEQINIILKQLKDSKVIIDGSTAPISIINILESNSVEIINKQNPCALPKACKNNVELKGIREAHITDGIALCRFLCWLETNIKNGTKITECDIDTKLIEFRQQHKAFEYPSFDTIAGYRANGAIIHYRAKESDCATLEANGLLLIDSGGQYIAGTTDVTRTIALSCSKLNESINEEKTNFTLVLKGHINLAMAKFPEKTTGHALDILARKFLWENGLDYDHGTGHGVGAFLNVHEGPQNISKRENNIALQKGMIISNEPGYYKDGEYGIRIENLVEVVESHTNIKGQKKFYEFDTITLAPIDLNLVINDMLDDKEKNWLNDYHKKIYKFISPYLEGEDLKWLEKATISI